MKSTTGRSKRWMAATSITFALVLGATACGSDAADDATDDTTETTTATGATEPGTETTAPPTTEGYDPTEFCEANLAFDTTPTPGGEAEPTPEEIAAYLDEALPLAEQIKATAPEELADIAANLVDTYTTVKETGDPSGVEDPAFAAEGVEAHKWLHENCGYQQLSLTGKDYAFEGIPTEVEAGPTSIFFTNATEAHEVHEMVLFKRLDGATESVEDLLALPDEELFTKIEFKAVVFAEPEKESGTLTDLDAGGYIGLCFLPTGGAEGNPPHFTKGMMAEFTVA